MKYDFTAHVSSLIMVCSLAMPPVAGAVSIPPCLSQHSDEYEISVALPDTLAPGITHFTWSVDGMDLAEQTRRVRFQFGPYDEGIYRVTASDASHNLICSVSIDLKAQVAETVAYVDPYPVSISSVKAKAPIPKPVGNSKSVERLNASVNSILSERALQATDKLQVSMSKAVASIQEAGTPAQQQISVPLNTQASTAQLLLKSVNIKVYFVTERIFLPGSASLFGPVRSPDKLLRYGVASITVPTSHKRMFADDPVYWSYSPKDFTAGFAPPLTEVDFYRKLSEQIATGAPDSRQVFVFIHGFNNGFKEDIYKTAQLAYDTHFVGAPIMFDWPSEGRFYDYTNDRTAMGDSIKNLADFLHDLGEKTGAANINVIAHSMGNRLLLEALDKLHDQNRLPTLGQIIMAAPDIDQNRFLQIMPALLASNTIKRITIYGSHKDKAMWLSRIANGVDAIGKMPPIVPLKGVDEVDVSDLSMNFLGHDYFFSTRPVLDDMVQLLQHDGKAPPRFGLVPAMQDAFPYWRISPSSQ